MWTLGAFLIGVILGWILRQIYPGKDDSSPADSAYAVKDDLTKVEGIGGKIQELLNNENIWIERTSILYIIQLIRLKPEMWLCF